MRISQTNPITISLSQTPDDDGMLEIRIKPWSARVRQGDPIYWTTVSNGRDQAPNPIVKVSIVPLSGAPTFAADITPQSRPDGAGVTGSDYLTVQGSAARLPADVESVTSKYAIDIVFLDDEGHARTARIDPDMIVET